MMYRRAEAEERRARQIEKKRLAKERKRHQEREARSAQLLGPHPNRPLLAAAAPKYVLP
jgi:hypothetical protein